MIRVSVTLLSAVDGSATELARMDIANDGKASVKNFRNGTYDGVSYIGRDTERLNKGTVSKRGRLEDWPRMQLHVWNMVCAMLHSMGYTQGVK
jgi:hypothetical protein